MRYYFGLCLLMASLAGATPNEVAAHPGEDIAASKPQDEIRFALKLRPYELIKTGADKKQARPLPMSQHTLRAKIDRPNHFYFGAYHVETRPTQWIKKIGKLTLEIHISKRFGSTGQVEEPVGQLDLEGFVEQIDRVQVLNAIATKSFKDPLGFTTLEVLAGFNPSKEEDASKAISHK